MVVLRLRRGGRRHDPHYRIVAQEKRSKLNGAYIEAVGHYHPTLKDKPLEVDKERVKHWLGQGAQASVTVNNLLVKAGVLPKKNKISRVYSAPAKEVSTETEAASKAEDTPKEDSTKEAEPVADETPAEVTEEESQK